MAILVGRLILLALFLYEKFIHHMPKHTVLKYSAACLSVIFKLLPGLNPSEFQAKVFTGTRTAVIRLQCLKVFLSKCMYFW